MNKQKILKFANICTTVFLIATGVFILSLAARVFVYDKFPVSTMSMYPTIMPGDHILVNKLVFGARIYKNMDFIAGDSLEAFRSPGFRDIRRNDIVVFNFPFGNDNWQKIEFKINRVFAKRCLAIPGDTLSIADSYYHNSGTTDTVGYYPGQRAFSNMPDAQIPVIVLTPFPFDGYRYPWTTKNFGPLYIPRKGDEIALDTTNFVLFKLPIEYETNKKLGMRDGRLYLGDIPISQYRFGENYYFMGGDNVPDSQDSRYFGLIPEKFIVGVVTRILYSRDKNTDRLRWDRLMKSL